MVPEHINEGHSIDAHDIRWFVGVLNLHWVVFVGKMNGEYNYSLFDINWSWRVEKLRLLLAWKSNRWNRFFVHSANSHLPSELLTDLWSHKATVLLHEFPDTNGSIVILWFWSSNVIVFVEGVKHMGRHSIADRPKDECVQDSFARP